MQLVDVLNKLRELEKTNESVKDAIDSAKRMNGEDNLTEAQRLYSVKLENDKGVTKNVRVKAGSEQEAKDSATMDPKFKAVSARVVDAPADDEEDDDLEESFEQGVAEEEEVAEGFKDMATELGPVADNEDYETLRDLISSEGEIGKYLGDMITDFSAEKGLHPDDDYEELEHLVMDRLIHEFGNQFDEAATTEELNQIRKLSGFAEAKLDPVGKEDDDVNNDGEVDSTDDYLKNRREKIAKSMKESVDLTECGMMPENMGMMHNTPATVTMTATASSGSEVSSMLKDILTLAGQRSHADAYVMDGGCSMEEDGGFAAATSGPNEFEASVEQQLQQGDDMHKPHEQHAAMAKLGDNPMASEDVDQLAESLWQQFNATK